MAKKSKAKAEATSSAISSHENKDIVEEVPVTSDGADAKKKAGKKAKEVKDHLHTAIGWPMKDLPAIFMLYYITDTMQGTPKLAVFLVFSFYRKVRSVVCAKCVCSLVFTSLRGSGAHSDCGHADRRALRRHFQTKP
jgi:hypothetical protein